MEKHTRSLRWAIAILLDISYSFNPIYPTINIPKGLAENNLGFVPVPTSYDNPALLDSCIHMPNSQSVEISRRCNTLSYLSSIFRTDNVGTGTRPTPLRNTYHATYQRRIQNEWLHGKRARGSAIEWRLDRELLSLHWSVKERPSGAN
jgi:hypothetical protein